MSLLAALNSQLHAAPNSQAMLRAVPNFQVMLLAAPNSQGSMLHVAPNSQATLHAAPTHSMQHPIHRLCFDFWAISCSISSMLCRFVGGSLAPPALHDSAQCRSARQVLQGKAVGELQTRVQTADRNRSVESTGVPGIFGPSRVDKI